MSEATVISRAAQRGNAGCSRRRHVSALWLALPLALMVAIRGDTRDTLNYVNIFKATTELPLHPLDYYAEFGVEWGFGLFSWALNTLELNSTVLFISVSAATFFLINRTALRLQLSFYEVMPYYLGTFFLTQQLMQIRQGLGIAFAFWMLVKFTVDKPRPLRLVLGTGVAIMIHVVSVLPLVSALFLRLWLPAPRRRNIVVWTLTVVALGIGAARVASDLQIFELFDRLTVYASDDEYNSARGLFDAANVRAVLLLGLLLFSTKAQSVARSRVYILMLGLYALHVGTRLGFLDFQIISGRLSTAIGFAEVFLLPMAARACIKRRLLRTLVAGSFLLVHAVATLSVQVPFLLDDYFTPIHADYSAG